MLPEFNIKALNSELRSALQAKIDQKTKPLGALGRLEDLALQIGLIQQSLTPTLVNPTVLVFAADHGLADAGVSAYPQSVTAQMVVNFLNGGAAINVFTSQHGLELFIVDAGVNADLPSHPQLISAKIAKSTRNCLTEPAMTPMQMLQAINTGANLVQQQHNRACNCIGFGEMGIGNTSSAALIMHKLTGIGLEQCAGLGTGLNQQQFNHKLSVLQQVSAQHLVNTPLDALSHVGGFEIAMMVGAFLRAAECRMVTIVDGFIASAALLVASRIKPEVLDYCIFSHVSDEQGHALLLREFNANALLQLNMRLGEGSGIAVCYPLIQSAVNFLTQMASFSDAGVAEKLT